MYNYIHAKDADKQKKKAKVNKMNNINHIDAANIINIKYDFNRLEEFLTELEHCKWSGDYVNEAKYSAIIEELGQSVNQRIQKYEHLFTKKDIADIDSYLLVTITINNKENKGN